MTKASCCTQYLPKALEEYEHWRVHEAGFSIRTWAGEKPGLLAFVDHMREAGVHYCADLTHEHVSAWWTGLRLKDNTKATRLHQLRSFLEYCAQRKWMKGDPTALLRAVRPGARVRDRLTADELLDLVETGATPPRRIILALAANTALRASEIRDLRLRDLDLPRQELRVRPGKTRSDEDAMPVTVELDRELRRWLDVYLGEAQVTRDSYLVPSVYADNMNGRLVYRHDRQMGVHYAAEVVKDGLAALGWDGTLGEGVHTVRRSLARLFFDAKEAEGTFDSALLATMELLHHTRSETTLHYIGRSRGQAARDSVLKGKPFLTTLASTRKLRAV